MSLNHEPTPYSDGDPVRDLTPKPCPFCGRSPTRRSLRHFQASGPFGVAGSVVCSGCLAKGPAIDVPSGESWEEWRDRAIEEWNKRA